VGNCFSLSVAEVFEKEKEKFNKENDTTLVMHLKWTEETSHAQYILQVFPEGEKSLIGMMSMAEAKVPKEVVKAGETAVFTLEMKVRHYFTFNSNQFDLINLLIYGFVEAFQRQGLPQLSRRRQPNFGRYRRTEDARRVHRATLGQDLSQLLQRSIRQRQLLQRRRLLGQDRHHVVPQDRRLQELHDVS
jgi:hypothetical protein